MTNYKFMVDNLLDASTNSYNIYSKRVDGPILKTTFSTFHSERSLRFVRLYNLLFLFTGQRPFLKRFKFTQVKKKILKSFTLAVQLNKKNQTNFILYLAEFYTYFFQIFYQKRLKGSGNNVNFNFYFDNIQYFVKNYGKHGQRSQLRYQFKFDRRAGNSTVKYISNYFLIKQK